jgi:hypothetical protein
VKKFLASCLVVLGASTSAGCIAVAAGAAAGYGASKVASNGDARDFAEPLTRVWHATLAALREHGYPIADSAPLGPAGGRVSVNDVTADVDVLAGATVRVTIRVGTFDTAGHRVRAAAILDSVARRLAPVSVAR